MAGSQPEQQSSVSLEKSGRVKPSLVRRPTRWQPNGRITGERRGRLCPPAAYRCQAVYIIPCSLAATSVASSHGISHILTQSEAGIVNRWHRDTRQREDADKNRVR